MTTNVANSAVEAEIWDLSATLATPNLAALARQLALALSEDGRKPDMMRELLEKALWLFDDESREPRLFGRGRPSLREPPPKPGLYRLIRTDNGKIWYIGQASNLAKRIPQHKSRIPGIEWKAAWKAIGTCFTEEAYDRLRELEDEQIAKHNPEGNRRGGGGGAPPHAFEACERPRFKRCRHRCW